MIQPEDILLNGIACVRAGLGRPIVVALDGASGSGKSTIAASLKQKAHVAHVPLDDFYQTQIPESELSALTVKQRLDAAFEWHRVRVEALQPLRERKAGRWHAFDFLRGLTPNGTYALRTDVTEVAPAPIVLIEGLFSASPQLRKMVDFSVLVDVPQAERHRRIAEREGRNPAWLAEWHAIWDDVETHYLSKVCPPESFDLVLLNNLGAGQSLPAEVSKLRG